MVQELSGLWSWNAPMAVQGAGDFMFFRYILGFLSERIDDLGFDMLARVSSYVGYLALILMTLYIFIQGYRVVTGQLRESMMGLVVNMTKASFIVTLALSFGVLGSTIHTFLVTDMRNGIHELVTGNSGSPEAQIDESLKWMQVAMSSVDMLESVSDPGLVAEKERATFYIGLGTGGPAITAGTMLLLYEIAMALFIGLGPIFILCLLFDYTKGLFQKWLFYGIGTMFSMALLSAMVSIALDMVTRVAAAMWTSALAGQLLLGENVVGGMNSMAMQQGGMGLILTALIVSAPPMAAMFFNGVMGNFMHFSAFGAGGAPGPQGQPPGSYGAGGGYGGGYQPAQPERMRDSDAGNRNQSAYRVTTTHQANGLSSQPVTETGPGPGARGAAQNSPIAQTSGPTNVSSPPPKS